MSEVDPEWIMRMDEDEISNIDKEIKIYNELLIFLDENRGAKRRDKFSEIGRYIKSGQKISQDFYLTKESSVKKGMRKKVRLARRSSGGSANIMSKNVEGLK